MIIPWKIKYKRFHYNTFCSFRENIQPSDENKAGNDRNKEKTLYLETPIMVNVIKTVLKDINCRYRKVFGETSFTTWIMVFKILLALIGLSTAFAMPVTEEKPEKSQPYHFEYEAKADHGIHYRKEESDGHGHVKGMYGYLDTDGMFREVQYVADEDGFRAEIMTNEPGTTDQKHADVQIMSFAEPETTNPANHDLEQRSSNGNSKTVKSLTPVHFQFFQQTNDKDKGSPGGIRSYMFQHTGEHGGHE
ncbi:Cuticle protein 16.8 like protein [Argiope bruennichi]|uniref:Cuticle protein 16.8 like protein n=1 Tax=Argiope bruennichi TaxID=94029 RepID=A0A8T0EIA3_ARGBR|nr:Cuticle protein 16.8 like protein [Argiope bruennichi]